MLLTKRNNSTGVTLPELAVPPEHLAIRHSTPPDLKGLKYTHLPGLGSDGRSSEAMDAEGPVLLLPVLDEPHPFPYIISPSITLTGELIQSEETQLDDEDELEVASHYFLLETQFSKEFLEDLLTELLQQEFFSLSQLAVEMDEKNETPPEIQQTEPLLEDENIENEIALEEGSDEENFTDDDFNGFVEFYMEIELDLEARNLSWEFIESLLSEWELTKANQSELQHLSPKLQQALTLRMAGQTPHDEEAILLDATKIEVVLFEYHHMLQQQKLEDNEALHHFQTGLIGNSLTSLILKDSLHHLKKDFDTVQNEESRLPSPHV